MIWPHTLIQVIWLNLRYVPCGHCWQLCELVRTDGFDEWLELAANFTVKSFQQWQWFANRYAPECHGAGLSLQVSPWQPTMPD